MLRAFFLDRHYFWWAWGVGLLLVLMVVYQVLLMLDFNDWYKQFYDLVQTPHKHHINEFWGSIKVFAIITAQYIPLQTLNAWVSRHYAFRWRKAVTFSYLYKWRKVEQDIEGSSQRIQEDIRRFSSTIESLGLQALQAVLLLLFFTPILWHYSSDVHIPLLEGVPGSLVWVAFVVSVGGMLISWVVGIKLPGLEYNNQRVEAAFRKELVYAEDNKKDYADLKTIFRLFTGLKKSYYRLYLHYGYFDIWLIFFMQLMVVVPFVLMGPSLMSGAVLLGVAMQVANAFEQVQESLSIFINNWTTITELRSIHKRLREFEHNIGY